MLHRVLKLRRSDVDAASIPLISGSLHLDASQLTGRRVLRQNVEAWAIGVVGIHIDRMPPFVALSLENMLDSSVLDLLVELLINRRRVSCRIRSESRLSAARELFANNRGA